MTCPECGAHPHESAAFCTGCGADLRARPDVRGPVAPLEEPVVRRPTPVNEMVGFELTAWIEHVWCSAAGIAR